MRCGEFVDPYYGKTFSIVRANPRYHPFYTGEKVVVVDTDLGFENDCRVRNESGRACWLSHKDWLLEVK